MARYVPQTIKSNRRRRLDDPPKIDTARVTTLGVFTILLGFFVGLVAWSEPNSDKSGQLISTLQNTFQPLSGGGPEDLVAAPTIPPWLQTSQEGAPPLSALESQFPDAFKGSHDSWGAVELHFSADQFQGFILGQPDLARRLVTGFTRPPGRGRDRDDFALEVTVGLKGRTYDQSLALLAKTQKDLDGLGVNPGRLLLGFEAGSTGITLRMVQNDRYEGAL